MDKNGYGHKGLYSDTKDGVKTQIRIRYNPRTDHIGFATEFQKSAGFVSGIVNNKNCTNYLGITVAEQVLFKVFNNVEMMLPHNRGFDFKCNHGYMIDVKSATTNKKYNSWMFNIKRNPIADYFLCLAFDNRHNLNPLYIWLIPAKKVNHLSTLRLSQSTFYKWSQYELIDKMDKVISCCNIMKGDN